MIELNKNKQLEDFEKFFGDKIIQLKIEFIKKNEAEKTITKLYEEKFKEYFLSQKDDLDKGYKDYMQAKQNGKDFTLHELVPLSIEIT